MPIAVSAVVRPSVCLRLLQAGFAICLLGAALMMGASVLPGGPLLTGENFLAGWAGAGVSALGGLYLLAGLRRKTKPRRLDLTGIGQIRLAEDSHNAVGNAPDAHANAGANEATNADANAGGSTDANADPDAGAAGLVTLASGSTLWPMLLLLRLRRTDGRIVALPVWRSAGACGAFRPLVLALRVLAARGGNGEEKM